MRNLDSPCGIFDEDIASKLSKKGGTLFKFNSLTLDERNDLEVTSQLPIFIRGISDSLESTE